MEETRRTLKAYQDIADTYDRLNRSGYEIRGELKAFTRQVAGGLVLDVGCGHGRDSAHLASEGLTSVGLDASSALIEIARAKAPEAVFLLCDMRQVALRDETVHGLWVCASFHHVPKRFAEATLREFHRVLRDSGSLALSVKEGEGERDEAYNRYGGGPRFYSFFHRDELEGLLSRAGFEHVSSRVTEQKRLSRRWVNTSSVKGRPV